MYSRIENRNEIRSITSPEHVVEFFPEYDVSTTVSPSVVGVGGEQVSDCDWLTPSYEISAGDVITRLLASIDDCFIFQVENKQLLRDTTSLFVDPFDGVVVGSKAQIKPVNGERHVCLRCANHLVELYATAFLVKKFEMELSDRVIQNAPQSAIDAIDRKYTSEKKDLAAKLDQDSSRAVNVTVPLARGGVRAVNVELSEDVTSLL